MADTLNSALASGDTTVRSLLLPELSTCTSGAIGASAAQYTGHHMPADMTSLAHGGCEQDSQACEGDGANAWVFARSGVTDHVDGKEMDSIETLILRDPEHGSRSFIFIGLSRLIVPPASARFEWWFGFEMTGHWLGIPIVASHGNWPTCVAWFRGQANCHIDEDQYHEKT